MRIVLTAVLSLVLGSAACSGASRRAPRVATEPVAAPAAAPRPAPTVLAWTRAKDGSTATYRLRSDGEALGREPGIRIATPAGEWTWKTTKVPVATTPCPRLQGAVPGSSEAHLTRASLVSSGAAGSQAEQVVVAPDVERQMEAAEITSDVTLLASLGPLLFVEETSYVYACGAHGMTSKDFLVWDAERAAEIPALEAVPDRAALRARAESLLRATDEMGMPAAADSAGPELTELYPVLQSGRVAFEAQVTEPTCYACGDGAWDSYTRSVRVPWRPPPDLAERATVPAAVVTFASRHPEVAVRGWSSSDGGGSSRGRSGPRQVEGARPAPADAQP